MAERPGPERKLEYTEVKALYGRVNALFEEFAQHRHDVQINEGEGMVEVRKLVPDLPPGETAWVSIVRKVDGIVRLFWLSRVVQQEQDTTTGGVTVGKATTYSFLVAGDPLYAPIHSSKLSEQKELGVGGQADGEQGVLLDTTMSRPAVYEADVKAPILKTDMDEIESIIADWR